MIFLTSIYSFIRGLIRPTIYHSLCGIYMLRPSKDFCYSSDLTFSMLFHILTGCQIWGTFLSMIYFLSHSKHRIISYSKIDFHIHQRIKRICNCP